MSTFVDQHARDRLVQDLDSTLFVEAGAGTGKTTAVVSRIVALVRTGRLRMEELVAITFTVAAASELRVRIREGLEATSVDGQAAQDERARCATAATEVERARIETIHAFCSAVLRMHPVEAGLPPDFEPLADIAADLDVRERFRRWFDGLAPDTPSGEAVRRGLLLGLKPAQVVALFEAMTDNWDLLQGPPSWVAPALPDAVGCAHELGAALEACVALRRWNSTPDALLERLDALEIQALLLRVAQTEDEALAALLALERSGAIGRIGRVDNWLPCNGENVCRTIKQAYTRAHGEAEALLAVARCRLFVDIVVALREVVLGYAVDRQQRGLVSYQDLLVRARDLVRDHPAVRDALRVRLRHIVVDEFQDTDPLQAELAVRLCSASTDADVTWTEVPLEPGRLCLVGDPKQSIYRFRRADIALYAAVARSTVRSDAGAQVALQVNFRSGRRIIEAVNGVFGGGTGLMHADSEGVQATWVDLAAHDPALEGTVRHIGGALAGPSTVMWRAEAAAAAHTARQALSQPWMIRRGGELRPCRASDICILMPTRTNLRNLERALEAARLRYRLESGSLIVATQEVRDLLQCLRAIDDPTNQVAIVAALRTPAYACSDVDLLRWREQGGRWSYLRASGEAATVETVRAALDDLRRLHHLRHERSVPALLEALIGGRLMRAVAADDWRPRETLRRQRYVLDEVRALARAGRPTLHDAVEHLDRTARDANYDRVAVGADDDDCVRVMTVHAAKGLEFPIVLVVGLGRMITASRASLVSDRLSGALELRAGAAFATPGFARLQERESLMAGAERMRLLYVAMTRARDHLVVSTYRAQSGGEKTDAHLLEQRLAEITVVERFDPDPSVARTPSRPAASGESITATEHREQEAAWVAHRATLLQGLGVQRAVTATGLAHQHGGAAPDIAAAPDVAAQRRGRAGTALGRAVHAVLQVIDLGTLDGLEDLATAQATAEGLPGRAAAVARLVRAAAASGSVQQALLARHWREVPVGATIAGTIVEGFIDLLYEDQNGGLVVVDYKTDSITEAGVDARMEHYRIQGGVYALTLAEATGRRVSRVEFVFVAPARTSVLDNIPQLTSEVRALLG